MPVCAFDSAVPDVMLEHLRKVFWADAAFWREHRYSNLARCSSVDVGYFSYTHPLSDGPCATSLDRIIRHLLEARVVRARRGLQTRWPQSAQRAW